MANVFGLDIQSVLAEAIQAAGGLNTAVLIKGRGERDPNNPSRLVSTAGSRHSLEALVERRQRRIGDSLTNETVLVITMVAGTITPTATPEPDDRIEIGGKVYTLVRLISLDPAEALYEFEASNA